jgi:hypothetical protein
LKPGLKKTKKSEDHFGEDNRKGEKSTLQIGIGEYEGFD